MLHVAEELWQMSSFNALFLYLASKLYNDDSSAMNFHNTEAVPLLQLNSAIQDK